MRAWLVHAVAPRVKLGWSLWQAAPRSCTRSSVSTTLAVPQAATPPSALQPRHHHRNHGQLTFSLPMVFLQNGQVMHPAASGAAAAPPPAAR